MENKTLFPILDGLKLLLDESEINPLLLIAHFQKVGYLDKNEKAIVAHDVTPTTQITMLLDLLKSKAKDCLWEMQKLSVEHKWPEVFRFIAHKLCKLHCSSLIFPAKEYAIFQGIINKITNFNCTYSMLVLLSILEWPFCFEVKDPNKPFVGRENEIKCVEEIVTQNCGKIVTDRCTRSLVIHGLGGMGKTQLILNYCDQFKAQFDSIIWIDAESDQSITACLQRLAEKMFINYDKLSSEELEKIITQKLASIGSKCLIIFDNADGIDPKIANDINPFEKLPKLSSHCFFIITSRHGVWKDSKIIEISTLKQNDAINAVAKILDESSDDVVGINELVSSLHCFPLAISLAAHFIQVNKKIKADYSCVKYLSAYQDNLTNSNELNFQLGNTRLQLESVFSTWKLTFDKIAQLRYNEEDIEAENLPTTILNVSAFLCAENIPIEMFLKIAHNEKHLLWAIETLQSYSMVNTAKASINIHRLLQQIIRKNLNENSVVQSAAKLLVNYAENETTNSPSTQQTLLLHLMELKRNINKTLLSNSDDFDFLYMCILNICHNFREAQLQKTMSEEFLLHVEQRCGKDNIAVAWPLSYLSLSLGDPQRQKILLERALKIVEQHYGPDHFEVAITLMNLGNAYGDLGDQQMKKTFLERALKIKEQHYGPDHFQVAATLTNLGNAYGDLGDQQMMKTFLERALKIEEQHYGPDHFEVAITLMNLGCAYGDLGDQQMQKTFLERALKIKEQHYGPDHFEVARTLVNLGCAYGDLGDQQMKKTLLERALKIEEQHYGPDHFEVAITLTNLGCAYGDLGDQQMKKTFLERALKIQEQHYPPDNFNAAITRYNLAVCLFRLGKNSEARSLLENTLVVYQNHYGFNHQYTKNVERLLASLNNEGPFTSKVKIL